MTGRQRAACAGVAALHALAVVSIARQPFDVGSAPPERRSAIWGLHNDSAHRVGPGADFFAVYYAGRALRDGHDPYGFAPRGAPGAPPYHYQFRYLPAAGYTLGWIAAGFPPRAAWWLWIASLEALLGAVALALLRRLPDAWPRPVAFALLYLSSPYFLELHMGQFTFAALSLAVLALLLAEAGAPGRGPGQRAAWAACLSASLLLKPLASVVAPALARERRHWPGLALALGLVVATSAPYFAAHPEQWRSFAALNLARPFGGMHSGNHGLLYLLFLALGDLGVALDAERWQALLAPWRAAWLGATAALVLGSRCERLVVGGAAMLLAHFLGFAHVWEHHMSGLLVVGVALWGALESDRGGAAWPRRLALAALVALALPTTYALFDPSPDPSLADPAALWPRYASYANAACKALPTLVLFAVCVATLHRSGWRFGGLVGRGAASREAP